MEKVALVTGANQGLGFALVARLCGTFGPEAVVYLGARDEARGRAAVETLEQRGLRPRLLLLDVGEDASVAAAAELLRGWHGGVDMVISNAAARITKDRPQAEQVDQFVNVNNHGTRRMIESFGSLLRDGGRFVVVASSFGSLRNLDPRLHPRFDVDTMTLEGVERVMDAYAAAVKEGRDQVEGWPAWINVPSKIGQVASMKVFARRMAEEARRRDLLINASCPGLVDTAASRPWFEDMSKAQSPDAAAVAVVDLATLPSGTREPYGELVRFGGVLPWR